MNFPNEFRTRDMDIPYLLQHIFSRVSAGKGARAFTVFSFFLFLSFFFPRLGIRRGNVSMIGSRLVRVPSALFIFETAIGERYAAQSCGVLNVFSDSRPTLPDCSRDDDSQRRYVC